MRLLQNDLDIFEGGFFFFANTLFGSYSIFHLHGIAIVDLSVKHTFFF